MNQLRIPILMFCDALLINLSIIIPCLVHSHGKIPQEIFNKNIEFSLFLTPVILGIFYSSRLYHRIWTYASMGELITIIKAISMGVLAIVTVSYFSNATIIQEVILSVWVYSIVLIGGSRFAWRLYVERNNKRKYPLTKVGKKVLIYGAGSAGALVAREYENHYNGKLPVIGFIDDDPAKHHLKIYGLPVFGDRKIIPTLVSEYCVEEIIIAMPSVSGKEVREIIEFCKELVGEVKILPGVYQFLNGNVSINKIRPVDIEDLLGREPVQINLEEISHYLKRKVVLITGAGGSIGSELCRQIAQVDPEKIILLGHGENSIYKIWLELRDKFPLLPLEIEIADVRDRFKLELVFAKHRPRVVFHAAAHKHVPLMEMHPDEAIKTNVFGTKYVAEMADRFGAERFVLISTDKAVNPSSVMGATKRIAELIIQNLFKHSDTKFAAVRFGNVLGSRGSVVPIFKEQIARGGPITVTHPGMTRYFMTIPEAVQLVIQAGAMAEGGEVFLLDMGEPVKIVDLAANLIKLSGLEPGKDIEIKVTGIRPGEKLFEELLTTEEGSSSTKHKRIFIAKPVEVDEAVLLYELLKFSKREVTDADEIFERLERLMPKLIDYRTKNGSVAI